MTRNLTRLALKVSVGYAVIAGLWVLLSDRVLELVIKEPASLAFWGTIKGWFFVVVTAALLYAFLRRELRRADLEAEARAEVEEALRRSESRFREVVETINEVFWVFEPGTRQILYISPGFERIWGRKTEELLGSPMLWLDAVSSGLRERVRTAFDRIPHGGRFDEEYTITRPDGEVRWIHDRGFPIRDDAGVLNRIVGVARDITDRKSLERQFLRAQRLESIGTLASGVAHDLNNILAPILMGSSLLKNDASPPEDQKVVDMIEAAAKRGAGIIRQLLTFSRGVEGQRVLVQVRHLMKETGDMLRETLPKNIRIETSAPGNLWPVLADATLMHQVIMNLCVNARDAMPAGGLLSMTAENTTLTAEQVKVGSGAMPGPYVLVTVADTGEGIATESIERIFDPFFTTKEVGRGTGLGLSTALGIVRSHGGFMTVASEPGRGSVFKVHLPAIVAGDAVAGATGEAPVSRGRGELILLVDDEPPVLKASGRVLEDGNYRVLSARNGDEAIKLFLENQGGIQLVITDIMMPGMDGLALIRAIRLVDPRIAIIATSGLDQEDKRSQLIGLGVTGLLQKPCSADQLRAIVAGALGGSGPRVSAFAADI